MILESGKYYRLRDGQVVGPMEVSGSGRSFRAELLSLGNKKLHYWGVSGDGGPSGIMYSWDIISEDLAPTEKPEPKRVRFVQVQVTDDRYFTALDDAGQLWAGPIGSENSERVVVRWTRIEGPEVGT
jgi:hypothetical protein